MIGEGEIGEYRKIIEIDLAFLAGDQKAEEGNWNAQMASALAASHEQG